MHKRLLNELTIGLEISPDGPLLIKGSEHQADPALPDMSFVRTRLNGIDTVYLPGSSLKGVIRSHCERLARTVDSALACKPVLGKGQEASAYPSHHNYHCGKALEKEKDPVGCYGRSCFVCRLFGNTVLGGRLSIRDAHPDATKPLRIEERNGVAIDRVFGSVAAGPFNYEVITEGTFSTELHIKNYTMAQIGLLLLAIRDLTEGRLRMGLAKSRGLGLLAASVTRVSVRLPMWQWSDHRLVSPTGVEIASDRLHGAGSLLDSIGCAEEMSSYGLIAEDWVSLPPGFAYASDGWAGSEAALDDAAKDWSKLGQLCAAKWREAASAAR
jgi:CRISPR/Cas system CSM-associated protein Csm3 (group 7 of RAMP superfamily)